MLLLRFLLLLALSQCQGQPCDQPAIWAAEWRRPAGSSTTGALRSQIQSRALPILFLLPLLALTASASCSDSDLTQIELQTTPRHGMSRVLICPLDLLCPCQPVDPPRWWGVAVPVRSQPCNAKTWSLSTAFTDGSIGRCCGGGRQDFMFSADLGCYGTVTGQVL